MNKPKITSINLKYGRKILTASWEGSGVFCRKYVGTGWKVLSTDLKAEVGVWYCCIQGNPFNQEGEGRTPEDALADSIKHNLWMICQLEMANRAIEKIQSE